MLTSLQAEQGNKFAGSAVILSDLKAAKSCVKSTGDIARQEIVDGTNVCRKKIGGGSAELSLGPIEVRLSRANRPG